MVKSITSASTYVHAPLPQFLTVFVFGLLHVLHAISCLAKDQSEVEFENVTSVTGVTNNLRYHNIEILLYS